ncbi:hypothetical protein PMAYCL1PPCAC_24744, partial [Pristionchus mayeri]
IRRKCKCTRCEVPLQQILSALAARNNRILLVFLGCRTEVAGGTPPPRDKQMKENRTEVLFSMHCGGESIETPYANPAMQKVLRAVEEVECARGEDLID